MIKIKDDKAAMMVLEAVIFAIMILLALILVTNLSPVKKSSVDSYSNQLKILADDAIRTLDNLDESDYASLNYGAGTFLSSRLVEYIALNDTTNTSSYFDKALPDNVRYNIYISNNEETICWYNGEEGFGKLGDVSKSNFVLAVPSVLNESLGGYQDHEIIPGYSGFNYIFILEMWEIL